MHLIQENKQKSTVQKGLMSTSPKIKNKKVQKQHVTSCMYKLKENNEKFSGMTLKNKETKKRREVKRLWQKMQTLWMKRVRLHFHNPKSRHTSHGVSARNFLERKKKSWGGGT